jgi:DNA repair exonuclease SbcCD nuclease subunit
MRKPIAVLISDIHFAMNSRELAAEALRQAIVYGENHDIPVIVAGDLHDTKAVIRGECANTMIQVLAEAHVPVTIMVGNHDLVNEKGDEHVLRFLERWAGIVDAPTFREDLGLWLIPYQTSTDRLREILAGIPHGSTLIMHQGLKGAKMGEYVVDKTSIEPEHLAPYQVISGHYHQAQDIVTDGKKHATYHGVGTFRYIGTPYTVTATEAHDGPKGFRVLHSDGSMELVPTNLRKHVTVERTIANVMDPIEGLRPNDILWIKVTGPATELQKLSKKAIGMRLLGHENFKLDKIYTETQVIAAKVDRLTDEQLFDKVIEESDESPKQKRHLKELWREILVA